MSLSLSVRVNGNTMTLCVTLCVTLCLTLCPLHRSEVSIFRGSRQASGRAEPHLQLLPRHRGGRLGGSVVGRARPLKRVRLHRVGEHRRLRADWTRSRTLFVCATHSLCVSKAYTPRQPMGGSRWENPRLVPRGPGRRTPCYHLSPWQRRDQVGEELQGGDP